MLVLLTGAPPPLPKLPHALYMPSLRCQMLRCHQAKREGGHVLKGGLCHRRREQEGPGHRAGGAGAAPLLPLAVGPFKGVVAVRLQRGRLARRLLGRVPPRGGGARVDDLVGQGGPHPHPLARCPHLPLCPRNLPLQLLPPGPEVKVNNHRRRGGTRPPHGDPRTAAERGEGAEAVAHLPLPHPEPPGGVRDHPRAGVDVQPLDTLNLLVSVDVL
mmetsp:Transcript_9945/g.23243  ORF Transcript_9945/g.23243 Transcript_9945/m.23243 type:complete len:215 (+) Transcript_9945:156-800(+)